MFVTLRRRDSWEVADFISVLVCYTCCSEQEQYLGSLRILWSIINYETLVVGIYSKAIVNCKYQVLTALALQRGT